MKVTTMLSVVLAMGLSVATWASSASAAVRDAAAGREGTVTRCLAEAHRHYPGKYYDWGEVRDHEYQRCMFDAGFPQ